jgi:hypothetical protein
MLAEIRPQISGSFLNQPKIENLKKPKAPLLAGLLHDILVLKHYLRLLGGGGSLSLLCLRIIPCKQVNLLGI